MTSIKTRTFGSEFMAMTQATEYMCGPRYKLGMFGTLVNEPTFVYGDKWSVLVNLLMPVPTLKNKSQSIAFHFCQEGFAADEWRTPSVN